MCRIVSICGRLPFLVINSKVTNLQLLENTLKHCSDAVCELLLQLARALSLYMRAAQPANGEHADVTSPVSPELLVTDISKAEFLFFRTYSILKKKLIPLSRELVTLRFAI